jgi:transcription elongation factor GreA
MDKPVYVTSVGLAKLHAELEHLRAVEQPAMLERLQDALVGSDGIDNTEYISIQDELVFVNSRIQELEWAINHAVLIEHDRTTLQVQLGSTVELKCDDGELEKYMIVGAAEADPARGFISNESPLGQALLERKAGDKVVVTAPAGEIRYVILRIS